MNPDKREQMERVIIGYYTENLFNIISAERSDCTFHIAESRIIGVVTNEPINAAVQVYIDMIDYPICVLSSVWLNDISDDLRVEIETFLRHNNFVKGERGPTYQMYLHPKKTKEVFQEICNKEPERAITELL